MSRSGVSIRELSLSLRDAIVDASLTWGVGVTMRCNGSKDRVNIIISDGVPLFFRHRDDPLYPLLKVLQQCTSTPHHALAIGDQLSSPPASPMPLFSVLCFRSHHDAAAASGQGRHSVRAVRREHHVPGLDLARRSGGR